MQYLPKQLRNSGAGLRVKSTEPVGSEEVRKASSEDILSVHPECLHITSQVLFLPWLSDESMEMMFLW